MRFAFNLPIFDHFSDPHALVDAARTAEDSGWDAVFLWDHVNFVVPGFASGGDHADPWIALGLIATETTRVLIGTCVTPIARRRPAKLAREILTLQRLSGGRFVFGAGLGDTPSEFEDLGEPSGLPARAARLDEGLELLREFWSGAPVAHTGAHYRAASPPFVDAPAVVPIWLAATWPNRRPFERAARYDGVCAVRAGFTPPLEPHEVESIAALVRAHRRSPAPFDLAVGANTTGNPDLDRAHARALARAGATWWLDGTSTRFESLGECLTRLRAGPPREPA